MAANPSPSSELQLTSEEKAGQIIVHGTGRITASTADFLETTVRCLIPQTRHIVIDFGGVDFIDSSGLGALVSVYMAASRAQTVVEISNPKQRIRDLFKLTKLSAVFKRHGANFFRGM